MKCDPVINVNWSPDSVPSGLYRRLFFRWPSGLKANETLPRICCEAKGVRVSEQNKDDYRFVIQKTGNDVDTPLMYPHALFGSAHLMIIGHEKFPLGALGLLHLRNHIIRYRPFGIDQPWDMKCELIRQRQTDKGFEFDFDSSVTIDGELVWQSVSTYLKRGKPTGEIESSPLADLFLTLDENANEIGRFDVSHNIGKRYAKVTGDYNPIHVSNLAAKLFGFKRAIAHGMWSIARAIQEMPALENPETPVRHDAAFKGPMFVVSKASIKSGADGRFDMFCGSNSRPVIVGVYRSTTADDRLS